MNKEDLKGIIKECIEETIVEENTNADRRNIINCIGNIYGHLLKYVEVKDKLERWAITIQNQINIIEKLESETIWNSISNDDMSKVIKRGREIFYNDNEFHYPSNSTIETVNNNFVEIRMLSSRENNYNFISKYINDDNLKRKIYDHIVLNKTKKNSRD